jgi:hypothetical protein
MWISLLSTLALAQDDPGLDARLLGTAPAPTVEVTPMARPPRLLPASDLTLTEAPWTSWAWSVGAPAAFLLLLGGAGWYLRRNGLRLAPRGFRAVEEGPTLQVLARTSLAGHDQLCLVEMGGLGAPRRVLVSSGPGGTRLIADLSATVPAVPAAPAPVPAAPETAVGDLVARAVREAIAASAPALPVPVPAMAGAPSAGPAPMPVPVPAPVPAFVSYEPDPEPRREPRREAGNEPMRSRAQGVQPFDDNLRAELDEPPRARRDARADWRANAYLNTAIDDPDDDNLGELGDGRAPTRPTPPRQASAQRGHLESLARPARPREARGLIKEAASRQDRTAAARALLENMVARKAQGER